MKVPKGAIARPHGGEEDDAPISAEEARELVRYMLKVGYSWRMRAETMFVMTPTADKRNVTLREENLSAAKLLGRLRDDVDNIDTAMLEAFCAKLNSDPTPRAIFEDGRFASVILALGVSIEGSNGAPWRPANATEYLTTLIAKARHTGVH